MANQTRTTGLPYFFADQSSAEALRRDLTEGPMAAATQDAIGSALELFTVLSALPAAFIDSQERELKRLESSGNEGSPRIDTLKASIEQARELHATASVGHARIVRSLVAWSSPEDLVHGFVSDASLTPLGGLTVRLTTRSEKNGDGKPLSAVTDNDGYYSISLGTSGARNNKPTTPVELSDRMAELLASVNAKAKAAASGTTTTATANADSTLLGQIDVLDAKSALLHRDPMPVVLDQGSVYREYVLVGDVSNRDPDPAPNEDPRDGKTAASTDRATVTVKNAAKVAKSAKIAKTTKSARVTTTPKSKSKAKKPATKPRK